MNWLDVNSLNAQDILKILPHRYPFLLIDRVLEIRTGKPLRLDMSDVEVAEAKCGSFARTLKNVTINEAQFQGHFPAQPIFPGVLTLEAMAQSAVFPTIPFVAQMNRGKLPELRVALAGFDRVRFRKPIVPGDCLEIRVEVINAKGSIWSIDGTVTVEGRKVAEGRLLAQLTFGENL